MPAVDGRCALRGRMGEAEVEAELAKLTSARFHEAGGRVLGKLRPREGQELEIEVDEDLHLSGTTPFGSIRIPLKSIVSVQFEEG